jgi:hypothetical protein
VEVKTHDSRIMPRLARSAQQVLSPAVRRARGNFKYFWVVLVHRDLVQDWPIPLVGCFVSRDKNAWIEITREAAEAKENWPALRAGLFGGCMRRLSQAEAFCRERLWGA